MNAAEIKKIERAGYTEQELTKTINMIFLLADVQEWYTMRLQRMLKDADMYSFAGKYKVDKAVNAARELVRYVDGNCSNAYAEGFGDRADELKALIDEWAVNN